MGIRESQLESWAGIGGSTNAKTAHEAIRAALSGSRSLSAKSVDVFLQGSYKNDTNIRGDSDVDVVVQLNQVWERDLRFLTPPETASYTNWASTVSYGWQEFRGDVFAALMEAFGSTAVRQEKNCITVAHRGWTVTADVVPCLEYRVYTRFHSATDQQHFPGIVFYTNDEGRRVINFPKPHYERGCAKNADTVTGGYYKPSVRMFKNARNYLVEKYGFPADHAPSYFLECLVYNAPDQAFGKSYADTFVQVVAWMNTADIASLNCQNGYTKLFGAEPTQWNVAHARELAASFDALWRNGV